jgi:hypothetical protein
MEGFLGGVMFPTWPASDYLSELLRPVIEREFRKVGKQLMQTDENL